MSHTPTDSDWMRLALQAARRAEKNGEVPIGAVLVLHNQKIAQAANASIAKRDPSAHAEIECLRRAGKKLGNYRLTGSTLYVTVEPCAMCAGALIWARVQRVVFGARDPKAGALGSVLDLSLVRDFNHQLQVASGVLAEDCRHRIQDFFKIKRRRIKRDD